MSDTIKLEAADLAGARKCRHAAVAQIDDFKTKRNAAMTQWREESATAILSGKRAEPQPATINDMNAAIADRELLVSNIEAQFGTQAESLRVKALAELTERRAKLLEALKAEKCEALKVVAVALNGLAAVIGDMRVNGAINHVNADGFDIRDYFMAGASPAGKQRHGKHIGLDRLKHSIERIKNANVVELADIVAKEMEK